MEQENTIRLISFVLIFIVLALWEVLMPRRTLITLKKWRWFNNLSIIAINPVRHLLEPATKRTYRDGGWPFTVSGREKIDAALAFHPAHNW